MYCISQHSSRDSGFPSDWEQERWNRQRADSISGSDMGGRAQRKLSDISCPSSARGMPHSASVFDLNNPVQHNHPHHGFIPVQQVRHNITIFIECVNVISISLYIEGVCILLELIWTGKIS